MYTYTKQVGAKMKNTIKRINKAFGKLYDLGDNGLDYLDRHEAVDVALIQHFYDETLDTLTKAELKELAEQLETVVSDAEFDIA
jgi:pyrroloquinoline quinone (PQQ) biosynthesis protein C